MRIAKSKLKKLINEELQQVLHELGLVDIPPYEYNPPEQAPWVLKPEERKNWPGHTSHASTLDPEFEDDPEETATEGPHTSLEDIEAWEKEIWLEPELTDAEFAQLKASMAKPKISIAQRNLEKHGHEYDFELETGMRPDSRGMMRPAYILPAGVYVMYDDEGRPRALHNLNTRKEFGLPRGSTNYSPEQFYEQPGERPFKKLPPARKLKRPSARASTRSKIGARPKVRPAIAASTGANVGPRPNAGRPAIASDTRRRKPRGT